MAGEAAAGDDGTTVSRARVEAAVASADVHPLLCAVASLTGDLDLLRPDLAPDQTQLITPARGLAPEQEAEARQLAVEALVAHAAAGRPGHRLTPDELRRAFAFLVGAGSTEKWERFLLEELALDGDPRAPSWHVDQVQVPQRPSSLPVCGHRRRCLGSGRGAPAAPGRGRGHGVREEPRRRRHLARERVPGLPGRRAQPALQLLLRPDQ